MLSELLERAKELREQAQKDSRPAARTTVPRTLKVQAMNNLEKIRRENVQAMQMRRERAVAANQAALGVAQQQMEEQGQQGGGQAQKPQQGLLQKAQQQAQPSQERPQPQGGGGHLPYWYR